MTDDESEGKAKKRGIRPTVVRGIVVGVVALIIIVGIIANWGTGTLSSFGWQYIAVICPLGALESMLGAFAFVPRLVIALIVVLVVIFITGRAFCGWVCPVPPLQSFFKTKKIKARESAENVDAGNVARDRYVSHTKVKHRFCSGCSSLLSAQRATFDSRYIVLIAALVCAAIFGFPVFCLVCPIGLSFGVVIGLINLIGFNEPSWSLLIFAVVLVLELTVLRKWCSRICPISALLSLIGKVNVTFRPRVREDKCLRYVDNQACGICAQSCPSHIDPHSDLGLVSISECTRCGKCSEACPSGAIHFPFYAKKAIVQQPDPELIETESK